MDMKAISRLGITTALSCSLVFLACSSPPPPAPPPVPPNPPPPNVGETADTGMMAEEPAETPAETPAKTPAADAGPDAAR